MAVDDHPFDALDKQFAMEDSSASRVTRVLLFLAAFIPWIWPFDKAVGFLKERIATDSAYRAKVMLETCMHEVRRQGAAIELIQKTLSQQQLQDRVEAAAALLFDATRRAMNTRAIDRIKRIGMILANSVIQTTIDADSVEEMMRVAMEMSDYEINYLGELVRIEGDLVASSGRVARYEAHTRWENGKWGDRVDPELDGVFSKLASYGLVAPVPPPNNLNVMTDFQSRYVLLPKGLHFYKLIQPKSV